MADNGNSRDYKHLKKITRGLWKQIRGRWVADTMPLPNYLRNNKHQDKLADYCIRYYTVYHDLELGYNDKLRVLKNIVININQYRLKHFYFDPIEYE